MDFTPEAVALAARLTEKLRSREKFHQFQPGEFLYCPDQDGFALHVNDDDHEDDRHVWLPRVDQMLEMALRIFGLPAVNLMSTAEGAWVATTTVKAGDAGFHGMGPTPERALMEMMLAAP